MNSNQIFSRLTLVIFLTLFVGGARSITSVQAADYTISKTADTLDGFCDIDCSLREAIVAANLNPGPDTIYLPSGIYTLTLTGQDEDAGNSGDLDITDDLTVDGDGTGITIVHGNHADRVFHIHNGATVGFVEMTITGGTTPDGSVGGGIYNQGSLTLNNSMINENVSFASSCNNSRGGGIYNEGSLILINSSLMDNTATWGGGVLSTGTLTVSDSVISGNQSSNGGVFGMNGFLLGS